MLVLFCQCLLNMQVYRRKVFLREIPGLYFNLLVTKQVKEWDPKCTFKVMTKHGRIVWLDKKQ